jgi:hypothetical protein
LYRGINDFEKSYQARTNKAKMRMVVYLQNSIVMAGLRNYFSQLLNVQGVNDVRHTEIYTAELLLPEPSTFAIELAIENQKSPKSPDFVQIPAELIKADP